MDAAAEEHRAAAHAEQPAAGGGVPRTAAASPWAQPARCRRRRAWSPAARPGRRRRGRPGGRRQADVGDVARAGGARRGSTRTGSGRRRRVPPPPGGRGADGGAFLVGELVARASAATPACAMPVRAVSSARAGCEQRDVAAEPVEDEAGEPLAGRRRGRAPTCRRGARTRRRGRCRRRAAPARVGVGEHRGC